MENTQLYYNILTNEIMEAVPLGDTKSHYKVKSYAGEEKLDKKEWGEYRNDPDVKAILKAIKDVQGSLNASMLSIRMGFKEFRDDALNRLSRLEKKVKEESKMSADEKKPGTADEDMM